MVKQALRVALVCAIALTTSGCFLRFILGGTIDPEGGGGRVSAFTANSEAGSCNFDTEIPQFFGCNYTIIDEDGFLLELTSTFQLVSEFGIFGLIVDPIVLELPADATNIAGTFDDGAGTFGDLVVYPNLSFVPVDDDETLTPAAGKQLAIVDLPQGVPIDGVTYEYSLTFEQPDSAGGPVEVKAIFTGKVEPSNFAGKTYYPTILPCTSDFATVSPIVLPAVADLAALEPLVLPTSAAVCMNRQYTYFAFPLLCDQDNDNDVDRADIGLILAMRNVAADVGDPRDIDGDGRITALDARRCVVQCTRPRCA